MKHVLVPVDFSDAMEPLIRAVEDIAKAFECTVHYLHVIPSVADATGWDLMRQRQAEFAKAYPEEFRRIDGLANDLNQRGCEADAMILQGPVARVILHEAERHNADFIIIGSHGHGALFQALVGSVCEDILRKAACPVIVVPGLKRSSKPVTDSPSQAGSKA